LGFEFESGTIPNNWHQNPIPFPETRLRDIAVAINSSALHHSTERNHSGSSGSCDVYFVILRKRKVLADNFSRFLDEIYSSTFSVKSSGSVTNFHDTHLISGPPSKNGPMPFNKLAVSAVNGALEIQPALANINFDFSLWKVAPPKEFEGVGAALTTFRRNEAENGCAHRTARKLGALFEKLLPTTPNLIKAYGQRASEISKASSIDAEARAAYGAFASRVGADATSLWAAATSGSSAIAVHLLACMLARIWEGPEATSIWVEITEKRKKDIKDDFEQNNISDIASLTAAEQELTRSQISE